MKSNRFAFPIWLRQIEWHERSTWDGRNEHARYYDYNEDIHQRNRARIGFNDWFDDSSGQLWRNQSTSQRDLVAQAETTPMFVFGLATNTRRRSFNVRGKTEIRNYVIRSDDNYSSRDNRSRENRERVSFSKIRINKTCLWHIGDTCLQRTETGPVSRVTFARWETCPCRTDFIFHLAPFGYAPVPFISDSDPRTANSGRDVAVNAAVNEETPRDATSRYERCKNAKWRAPASIIGDMKASVAMKEIDPSSSIYGFAVSFP